MLRSFLPPVVRSDAAGDGHFGAPRGSRTHRGVDYVCRPGGFVFAPISGKVTKLGYPYAGDLYWRYVEVTDDLKYRHRLFYVLPLVQLDELVIEGQVIGEAQNISVRYPSVDRPMTPHVHYEIIGADGKYRNPEEFA